MDSGSTSVFINRKRLPKGCVLSLLHRNVHSQTAAGLFVVNSHVTLRDIILPEFGRSLKIESLHAYVFDADCKYDILLLAVILWYQTTLTSSSRHNPWNGMIASFQ